MKRDLDLIRAIMLSLEENMEYGKNFQSEQLMEAIQDAKLSAEKLSYHVGLLVESDFITAKEYKYQSGESADYLICTITSQGHDFIDTIRHETTWNRVKEKAYLVGGFSLSLLVDIGKDYLKKQIGI